MSDLPDGKKQPFRERFRSHFAECRLTLDCLQTVTEDTISQIRDQILNDVLLELVDRQIWLSRTHDEVRSEYEKLYLRYYCIHGKAVEDIVVEKNQQLSRLQREVRKLQTENETLLRQSEKVREKVTSSRRKNIQSDRRMVTSLESLQAQLQERGEGDEEEEERAMIAFERDMEIVRRYGRRAALSLEIVVLGILPFCDSPAVLFNVTLVSKEMRKLIQVRYPRISTLNIDFHLVTVPDRWVPHVRCLRVEHRQSPRLIVYGQKFPNLKRLILERVRFPRNTEMRDIRSASLQEVRVIGCPDVKDEFFSVLARTLRVVEVGWCGNVTGEFLKSCQKLVSVTVKWQAWTDEFLYAVKVPPLTDLHLVKCFALTLRQVPSEWRYLKAITVNSCPRVDTSEVEELVNMNVKVHVVLE